MKKFFLCLTAVIAFATLPAISNATPVMPDFANVPTGWNTDRYNPSSFSNVGAFQGRNNVLGISISNSDGLNSRPPAYQSQFYNTQGKQHAVSGGIGSVLSADLFINSSWSDAINGNVRTDMWGVLSDATNAITDYPIIGFTNYGGARLRAWDNNGWHDLNATINYGGWNSFAMAFTGSSIDYSVNGVSVYTDSTSFVPSTGFSAVIMQAYNFNDPAITDANPVGYTANWSNTQPVPEPSTFILFGAGLAGVAFMRRRNKK